MKYLKYILPAALVIILIIVGYRSCGLYDRYSVLKGRYDALAEEYEAQRGSSLKAIEDLDNIIARKDEEINAATSHIVEKEGEISTLHTETDKLEADFLKIKDAIEKVDNLSKQLSIWKQKFTLAEGIIRDKDVVIFSINEKYEAQVKISLEWRGLYDREVTLHKLSQGRLRIAEHRIGRLKFGGTLKTGLVMGLVGVVAVGLIR